MKTKTIVIVRRGLNYGMIIAFFIGGLVIAIVAALFGLLFLTLVIERSALSNTMSISIPTGIIAAYLVFLIFGEGVLKPFELEETEEVVEVRE